MLQFVDEKGNKCSVCGKSYLKTKDNKKSGHWVGCEYYEKCGTWVERKCIGWSEKDVDSLEYYCEKCTKN